MRRIALGILAAALLAAGCTDTARKDTAPEDRRGSESQGVVRVYTSRHYGIEPVFESFTQETGIRVEFTTGGDAELRERLQAEGENTPADVFMTVDAASLYLAAEAGLLAEVRSSELESAVPENLRDPMGRWYALSLRIRAIAYVPERTNSAELSTYEALADPKWKKRLCLRPATHPYTISLVAGMIAADGPEETERVIRGWVANEPEYINSDTELLKNVAAGRCHVTLANSYYLGRILSEDPAFPVRLFWPNQDSRGAHVNISGAGVTRHSKNPEGARRLIEWLATTGQRQFADANFEYPANPAVPPLQLLASWGEFKKDPLWVRELGRLHPEAVRLLDRAGYL